MRQSLLNCPFDPVEVTCKCGCGFHHTDIMLLRKLVAARYIAAQPFVINSWCRCKEHNKAVGGTKNSAHLKGEAVDIAAPDNNRRFWIVKALIAAGFNRIGIGEDFVHVDVGSEGQPFRMWVY